MRCAVCVWVSGWRGVTACGFELHQSTTWNTHTLHKPQTQTCPNKIIHYKLISQHKFHTNIAVFFWFGLYELTGWMSIRRHKCCCQIQNSNKHFMHNVNIYITDEMTLSMMPPTIVKLNATTNNNNKQHKWSHVHCANSIN